MWLGVVIIAQSWVESYVFWLSWAELTIPVRSQLASLIFEKAMRRKDVKGNSKSKKKAGEETDSAGEPSASAKPDEPVDDSEELKKSK